MKNKIYLENDIAVHYDVMRSLLEKYGEHNINRSDFIKYALEKYSDVLSHKELCLIWQAFDMVYDNKIVKDCEEEK